MSARLAPVAEMLGWPVAHVVELVAYLVDDAAPMSSDLAETLTSCALDNVERSAIADALEAVVRLETTSQQNEHDALMARLLEV